LTPTGYADSIRKKFIESGNGSAEAVDRFMAIQVIMLALVIPTIWFFYFYNPVHLTGMVQLIACALICAVLIFAPYALLSRRVEERQHELRIKLPDILDARMLGEVRAGATRADAMRALDQRTNVPEVRSFVLAILQADTFGVSIGRVLRSQAEEMRIKRRQLAQERAQKAPVKMLIPMVFCVFPSLFVVVIGPAVINIRSAFSH